MVFLLLRKSQYCEIVKMISIHCIATIRLSFRNRTDAGSENDDDTDDNIINDVEDYDDDEEARKAFNMNNLLHTTVSYWEKSESVLLIYIWNYISHTWPIVSVNRIRNYLIIECQQNDFFFLFLKTICPCFGKLFIHFLCTLFYFNFCDQKSLVYSKLYCVCVYLLILRVMTLEKGKNNNNKNKDQVNFYVQNGFHLAYRTCYKLFPNHLSDSQLLSNISVLGLISWSTNQMVDKRKK